MKNDPVGLACYILALINGVAAALVFGGGDYSRGIIAGGLMVVWLCLGYKSEESASYAKKSTIILLLGAAALYLLQAVDFFMDSKYSYTFGSFAAFVATLGSALWLRKR